MTERVVKNSVLMGMGALVGGVVLLATIVVVARALGPTHFGDFILAITFASLFQMFADGGIVNITIRDVARAPERTGDILAKTSGLLWLVTAVGLFALVAVAQLAMTDDEHRLLCYGMGGAALCSLHASLLAGISRAHEDMGVVALLGLLHKILVLGLVALVLVIEGGLGLVAGAHFVATLVYWIAQWAVVRRRYGPAGVRFDVPYIRSVLAQSVPLGAGFVVRRFNVHVCTILLTLMVGSKTVGIYNSAYRFLQMAEIGALTLSSVLFPVFSKLYGVEGSRFQAVYAASVRFLVLISAPIAGVTLLLGEPLILALYGPDYLAAGPVLRTLGVALLVLVPGALFHSVFAAAGQQTSFMRLSVVGVVVNIVVCLMMVHAFEAWGAAIATLLSELTTFVVGVAMLRKLQASADYVGIYGRVALAGVVAALPVLALERYAEGIVLLVLGSVIYVTVYIGIAILVQAFRWSEVQGMIRRPSRPT